MQDSLNVENTPEYYHREHNVSGTTQASFLAKFKATQNKHSQKRQHCNVYMYYIYIYILLLYIYIYIYFIILYYIYVLLGKYIRKKAKT